MYSKRWHDHLSNYLSWKSGRQWWTVTLAVHVNNMNFSTNVHTVFRLLSRLIYFYLTPHMMKIGNTDNWKGQKDIFLGRAFKKKTALLSISLLFCVTLAEKTCISDASKCSVHTGLSCTHIVYVVLNFQTSLGKLTPVANSFSPLLYYTYIRGTTGPSVVYGNACWRSSEPCSLQTCRLSSATKDIES